MHHITEFLISPLQLRHRDEAVSNKVAIGVQAEVWRCIIEETYANETKILVDKEKAEQEMAILKWKLAQLGRVQGAS